MKTIRQSNDRIPKLARQKGLIEGIYNYCDLWCERCSFTSKCLIYSFRKDGAETRRSGLWHYLDNVYDSAMSMINDIMRKTKIRQESFKDPDQFRKCDPKDHPLYIKAYDLSSGMLAWLDYYRPGELIFEEKELYPELKDSNPMLYDALQVIYFYVFFISIKLYRALSDINGFDNDEMQADANGSAKIALIAIDRMMAAWSAAMENMKEHEDDILKFLTDLAEIRSLTEDTFPTARDFIRSGFDE